MNIANLLKQKKLQEPKPEPIQDNISDAVFSVWLVEQDVFMGTDDYNDLMSLPAHTRERIMRSW